MVYCIPYNEVDWLCNFDAVTIESTLKRDHLQATLHQQGSFCFGNRSHLYFQHLDAEILSCRHILKTVSNNNALLISVISYDTLHLGCCVASVLPTAVFKVFSLIKLYDPYTIMANADNSRRPRSRNLKRTFVFLRKDDELRVPGKQQLKNLQDSGREKEIEFSNNATTEHIAETLKNSFPAFLRNADLAR